MLGQHPNPDGLLHMEGMREGKRGKEGGKEEGGRREERRKGGKEERKEYIQYLLFSKHEHGSRMLVQHPNPDGLHHILLH